MTIMQKTTKEAMQWDDDEEMMISNVPTYIHSHLFFSVSVALFYIEFPHNKPAKSK